MLKKNVLVTGTGNKVEDFGIGFYTKYGDGGVDLSPIADLMKSQVKELAEFLNISKNIIRHHQQMVYGIMTKQMSNKLELRMMS